jgi:hypothetical protein
LRLKKDRKGKRMLYTKTQMKSEYFTIEGLQKRTGLTSDKFNLCIIKELLDNAMDAVDETTGLKTIEINYNSLTSELCIYDSGKDFNKDFLDKTLLDFDNYFSSKRNINSVKRGTQGNALKTIAGICFVNGYSLKFQFSGKVVEYKYQTASGFIEYDRIEKATKDFRKRIIVDGFNIDEKILEQLIFKFYMANSYVNFVYNGFEYSSIESLSPIKHDHNIHFYKFEEFSELLKSCYNYNSNYTIREFLKQFDSTKDKLSNLDYRGFKNLNKINTNENFILHLFDSLKQVIKPPTLKILEKYLIIGDVINAVLSQKYKDVAIEQSKTKKLTIDGIPLLLQGFLLSYHGEKREILNVITSVNQSITYKDFPFIGKIDQFLNRKYPESIYIDDIFTKENIDSYTFQKANYILYLSITSPKIEYNSYSKDEILAHGFMNQIKELLEYLLKPLVKAIRTHENHISTNNKHSITAMIDKYFDDAFIRAKGTYSSVMARQVFYVIRELINIHEGIDIGESNNIYNTFTQKIVTKYQDGNSKYDAIFNERRGYFYDIFFNSETPLATKEVLEFCSKKFKNIITEQKTLIYDIPYNQLYGHVLFIEKQGFTQLLKESGLLKELNLALICSQGFGTRASKKLIQYFNRIGIKVYCLHDCDLSGNRIFHNLANKSETFKADLNVIDIGINVSDVTNYQKLPESYKSKKSYSKVLDSLSSEERDFFGGTKVNENEYSYRRCEINSFTNDEIIGFIRDKIKPIDVVPSFEVLQNCIHIDKTALAKEILFSKYGHELAKSINLDTQGLTKRIMEIRNSEHWTDNFNTIMNEYKAEIIKEMSEK